MVSVYTKSDCSSFKNMISIRWEAELSVHSSIVRLGLLVFFLRKLHSITIYTKSDCSVFKTCLRYAERRSFQFIHQWSIWDHWFLVEKLHSITIYTKSDCSNTIAFTQQPNDGAVSVYTKSDCSSFLLPYQNTYDTLRGSALSLLIRDTFSISGFS